MEWPAHLLIALTKAMGTAATGTPLCSGGTMHQSRAFFHFVLHRLRGRWALSPEALGTAADALPPPLADTISEQQAADAAAIKLGQEIRAWKGLPWPCQCEPGLPSAVGPSRLADAQLKMECYKRVVTPRDYIAKVFLFGLKAEKAQAKAELDAYDKAAE